jgi:hypothetical protein
MKQRVLALIVALMVLSAPAIVSARPPEMEKEIVDGRLEGYTKPVTLESSSGALTWLLFVFLGAVGVAVMFKNAKRSHLD